MDGGGGLDVEELDYVRSLSEEQRRELLREVAENLSYPYADYHMFAGGGGGQPQPAEQVGHEQA